MAKNSLITFETEHVGAGITAGLLAGIVFGSTLAMSGDALFPALTRLAGVETPLGNFAFHVAVSIALGVVFAILLGRRAMGEESGTFLGIAYGIFWWIIGPLVLVPLILGEGTFLSVSKIEHALPLLWGHVIYGFTLGQIYPKVVHRVRKMKKMMTS